MAKRSNWEKSVYNKEEGGNHHKKIEQHQAATRFWFCIKQSFPGGLALPKQAFPRFRGVFIWMKELCQSEYSLFPNLWNHLRSLRCRITHTQGKSYAGLSPSLVMSFDKIVNGKLSLLGFKRSYTNWVDLRQMTTNLFWSNQWPQQPCHFIPFFQRRRKWHFSRFPSTNKTPRQQFH